MTRAFEFILITWLAASLFGVTGCTNVTSMASPTAIQPKGQIAFVGSDSNLWLLDLTSGEIKPLTTDERTHSPSWSPDGVRLAYLRESDLQRETVVLNVNSGTRFTIPALRESMLTAVSWSPDGRYLLGDVGCCPTGRELVLLDLVHTQVLHRLPYSFGYVWSPNSVHIALGRDGWVDPPLPIESGATSNLVLLDMRSGAEQILVQGTREALNYPVCWFSSKILVYSQLLWQTGQRKFWQITLDDLSKPIELASVPPDCDSATLTQILPPELQKGIGASSWSADKQWVVFSVTQDSRSQIYVVNVLLRTARQVAIGTGPVWRPVASR